MKSVVLTPLGLPIYTVSKIEITFKLFKLEIMFDIMKNMFYSGL